MGICWATECCLKRYEVIFGSPMDGGPRRLIQPLWCHLGPFWDHVGGRNRPQIDPGPLWGHMVSITPIVGPDGIYDPRFWVHFRLQNDTQNEANNTLRFETVFSKCRLLLFGLVCRTRLPHVWWQRRLSTKQASVCFLTTDLRCRNIFKHRRGQTTLE